MASRQCLGQNTVVGVMNKNREEEGFDAAQFGLFLILFLYLMLCRASISLIIVCCIKGITKS